MKRLMNCVAVLVLSIIPLGAMPAPNAKCFDGVDHSHMENDQVFTVTLPEGVDAASVDVVRIGGEAIEEEDYSVVGLGGGPANSFTIQLDNPLEQHQLDDDFYVAGSTQQSGGPFVAEVEGDNLN